MAATVRVRATRRIEHDQVVHEAGGEFALSAGAAAALLGCGAAIAVEAARDTDKMPPPETDQTGAGAAEGNAAPAKTAGGKAKKSTKSKGG